MTLERPLIAVTMGDPSGIGPEIIIKALANKKLSKKAVIMVVGDAKTFERILELPAYKAYGIRIVRVRDLNQIESLDDQVLHVWDLDNVPEEDFAFGSMRPEYGKAAGEFIEKAVELANNGSVHAIVTAPIHKESFLAGGFKHPGHTDMLAHLTNTKKYSLMLMVGHFRVSHLTSHVSLKDAISKISKERVLDAIDVLNQGLRSIGIDKPCIGVSGLNPHASDNGLFGDEEEKYIAPAVKEAKANGVNVQGPYPPDVVFSFLNGGRFDAVLAMYHDQGGIPMKLIGFSWDQKLNRWASVRGVNLTLGLPIIRTSVAHGTAFEIAGKGIADSSSLEEAIECAAAIALFKFNAK